MPWDKKKILIQIQVNPELANRIEELAKTDDRSRSGEIIYLIKRGIERREYLDKLVATHPEDPNLSEE